MLKYNVKGLTSVLKDTNIKRTELMNSNTSKTTRVSWRDKERERIVNLNSSKFNSFLVQKLESSFNDFSYFFYSLSF